MTKSIPRVGGRRAVRMRNATSPGHSTMTWYSSVANVVLCNLPAGIFDEGLRCKYKYQAEIFHDVAYRNGIACRCNGDSTPSSLISCSASRSLLRPGGCLPQCAVEIQQQFDWGCIHSCPAVAEFTTKISISGSVQASQQLLKSFSGMSISDPRV